VSEVGAPLAAPQVQVAAVGFGLAAPAAAVRGALPGSVRGVLPAEAQREIRRSLMHLAFMFESKEGREKAKKDSALFKLIEDARARGQATRLAREPPPPPPPAFPIFASAPPGDGGRRRRSRRGRKSRRKSLRQRK
jgi:hypothetical protein